MDKIIKDYIQSLLDVLTCHREERKKSFGVFILCVMGLNDSLREMTDNKKLIDCFYDIIHIIMINDVNDYERIYGEIMKVWRNYLANS
jgi:hypothetical protein